LSFSPFWLNTILQPLDPHSATNTPNSARSVVVFSPLASSLSSRLSHRSGQLLCCIVFARDVLVVLGGDLALVYALVIGAALALLLVSVCFWLAVQVGGVICCGGGVPAGSSTGPGRH
jgi:hypothetical protein